MTPVERVQDLRAKIAAAESILAEIAAKSVVTMEDLMARENAQRSLPDLNDSLRQAERELDVEVRGRLRVESEEATQTLRAHDAHALAVARRIRGEVIALFADSYALAVEERRAKEATSPGSTHGFRSELAKVAARVVCRDGVLPLHALEEFGRWLNHMDETERTLAVREAEWQAREKAALLRQQREEAAEEANDPFAAFKKQRAEEARKRRGPPEEILDRVMREAREARAKRDKEEE